MIRIRNVSIKYKDSVIENGEMTIPDGAVTAITGASGSGKTTLLCILGLISSQTGYEYVFDGADLSNADDMADMAASYPKQLSDGEIKRVAIACALAKNPDLIIADEPTSALDVENTELVMGLLEDIARNNGKKVVVATHDPRLHGRADYVYSIIDKRTVLVAGRKLKDSGNAEGNVR